MTWNYKDTMPMATFHMAWLHVFTQHNLLFPAMVKAGALQKNNRVPPVGLATAEIQNCVVGTAGFLLLQRS